MAIFACTVHVGTDGFWLKAQERFLARHLPGVRLVAAIEPTMMAPHTEGHFYDMTGTHQEKLDALAQIVTSRLSRSGDDILLFFDGDAFPIRDLGSFIAGALADVKLTAVCRREAGEDYPHPSFCATTVGFWRGVEGTWSRSGGGDVTEADLRNDLGCQLRDILCAMGTDWRPILRTNNFNPHPLMFGIYGGLIYHHGAGFRRPLTAMDRRLWRDRAVAGTWTSPDKYRFFFDVVSHSNRIMSEFIKRQIVVDGTFYRVLEMETADTVATGV